MPRGGERDVCLHGFLELQCLQYGHMNISIYIYTLIQKRNYSKPLLSMAKKVQRTVKVAKAITGKNKVKVSKQKSQREKTLTTKSKPITKKKSRPNTQTLKEQRGRVVAKVVKAKLLNQGRRKLSKNKKIVRKVQKKVLPKSLKKVFPKSLKKGESSKAKIVKAAKQVDRVAVIHKKKERSSLSKVKISTTKIAKNRSKSKPVTETMRKTINSKGKKVKFDKIHDSKFPLIIQKKERKPSKYFQLLDNPLPQTKKTTKRATQKVKASEQTHHQQTSSEQNILIKQQSSEFSSQPEIACRKSIAQVERIIRSHHDRIFLITAERSEESWIFKVMGTKGSLYRVSISTMVKCNCIDFQKRHKPCKHIYFIVTQVSKRYEIVEEFNLLPQISEETYKKLDEALVSALRARMNSDAEKRQKEEGIDLKDDTDCSICFCEMASEREKLDNCGVCKKYFHEECLKAWKQINNTCPLCRSPFEVERIDSLHKLEEVII